MCSHDSTSILPESSSWTRTVLEIGLYSPLCISLLPLVTSAVEGEGTLKVDGKCMRNPTKYNAILYLKTVMLSDNIPDLYLFCYDGILK